LKSIYHNIVARLHYSRSEIEPNQPDKGKLKEVLDG